MHRRSGAAAREVVPEFRDGFGHLTMFPHKYGDASRKQDKRENLARAAHAPSLPLLEADGDPGWCRLEQVQEALRHAIEPLSLPVNDPERPEQHSVFERDRRQPPL